MICTHGSPTASFCKECCRTRVLDIVFVYGPLAPDRIVEKLQREFSSDKVYASVRTLTEAGVLEFNAGMLVQHPKQPPKPTRAFEDRSNDPSYIRNTLNLARADLCLAIDLSTEHPDWIGEGPIRERLEHTIEMITKSLNDHAEFERTRARWAKEEL